MVLGVVQANDVPIVNKHAARDVESLAADPTALKRRIDDLSDLFSGYDQRDAHEFVRTLIDLLHKELENGTARLDSEADPLPTEDFFSLVVRRKLTCESCKCSDSKDEVYWDLSVPVGDDSDDINWSVQRCLESFFAPERVFCRCGFCRIGKYAAMKLEIIRL